MYISCMPLVPSDQSDKHNQGGDSQTKKCLMNLYLSIYERLIARVICFDDKK